MGELLQTRLVSGFVLRTRSTGLTRNDSRLADSTLQPIGFDSHVDRLVYWQFCRFERRQRGSNRDRPASRHQPPQSLAGSERLNSDSSQYSTRPESEGALSACDTVA